MNSFSRFLGAIGLASVFSGSTSAQDLSNTTVQHAQQIMALSNPDQNIKGSFASKIQATEKIISDDGSQLTINGKGRYNQKFGTGGSLGATYTTSLGNTDISIGGEYYSIGNKDRAKTVGVSITHDNTINATITLSEGEQSAQAITDRTDIDDVDIHGKTYGLDMKWATKDENTLLGATFQKSQTDEQILKQVISDSLITTSSTSADGLVTRTTKTYYQTTDTSTWTPGSTTNFGATVTRTFGESSQYQIDASLGQSRRTDDNETRTGVFAHAKGDWINQEGDTRVTLEWQKDVNSEKYGVGIAKTVGTTEVSAQVEQQNYNNTHTKDTGVMFGIKQALGKYQHSISKNLDTQENLGSKMESNRANPQQDGHIAQKTETKEIKTETTDTPNRIETPISKVKVNPEGTITVEFGTSNSGNQKPMTAASPSPDAPSTTIVYSLKITGPNNFEKEYLGVNPPWTSEKGEKFAPGTYEITLQTNNQGVISTSQPATVNIVDDNKEILGSLEVQPADYTTAIINFKGTKDANGIRNETWSVVGSSTASVSTPTEANTLVVTGGTPGETITVLYTFEYNKMNADGTDNWVKGTVESKPITFKKSVDSPTQENQPTVSSTYDSITATNNISDENGVTGQWIELYDEHGTIVGSRVYAKSYTWSGLTDNKNYTVLTGAKAGVLNADNTTSTQDVITKPEPITTQKAAVDNPTTITLDATGITSSSILAACNITDLQGAVGTCTISGGPGATSWNIGSDRIITDLSPNTTYTISVTGYAYILEKDGTLTRKDISESKPFTTLPPANTAPIGTADTANTAANTPVAISVLDNDTDIENNILGIGSFGQGSHGTVTQVGNTLQYTPANGYSGSDTFTYIISDGNLSSSPVTVTVNTAAPVNVPGTISAPTLDNKTATTISTTPGAVTGMSNVQVSIYSDAGLTSLVGTNSTGDFTGLTASTTYYIVTSATDLNENTGLNETKRSTALSVTTDAPVNVPGTISAPSLDNKTHSDINTTPGSTTGMTNIRVELYSNAGLTTLVGTNSTGDFTGLSASTTYYAVTVGDDYNENTGATETKRSTTLTVTTDVYDPMPTGPTLSNVTISDKAGGLPIDTINAGGATDPLGRTITYSEDGLPSGLTIDPNTGVIWGTYDEVTAAPGDTTDYSITVRASAGGSNDKVDIFILSIRNDG